jgi:hypothetical protein
MKQMHAREIEQPIFATLEKGILDLDGSQRKHAIKARDKNLDEGNSSQHNTVVALLQLSPSRSTTRVYALLDTSKNNSIRIAVPIHCFSLHLQVPLPPTATFYFRFKNTLTK